MQLDPIRTSRIATNEQGSVLALALILLVVLTISGTSFLQASLLENEAAMSTRWNVNSFSLANAGIERASEVFKIGPSVNWTSFLNGSTANFPKDAHPDYLLCPDTSGNSGCVIPSFQTHVGNAAFTGSNGDPMIAAYAVGFPFANSSDAGSYSVRAFNDVSGTTNNTSGRLIVRALGNVNGEKKVIEVNITATSSVDLINCKDATHNPPNLNNCYHTQGNPSVTPSAGHDPGAVPAIPTLDLSSPSNNYYGKPTTSFPGLTQVTVPGSTLTPVPGHYYSKTGDLTVNNSSSGTGMMVIYATGNVTVSGTVINAIVIGATSVTLSGTIESPSASSSPITSTNYPAVIAGTGGFTGNKFALIQGNVLSTGPISLDRVTMHGSAMGTTVSLKGGQGNTATVDDLPPSVRYYDVMPGITYPPALLSTQVVANSWKEIK